MVIVAPARPLPVRLSSPAVGRLTLGSVLTSWALTSAVVGSLGFAPTSVCVAETLCPSSSGFSRSTFQVPSGLTFAVLVAPSGRMTVTISALGTPWPEMLKSPAVIGLIVGWALAFNSAACTVVLAAKLSCLPASVWVAVITWSVSTALSSTAVHLLSSPTITVTGSWPGALTVILAPGRPVPEIWVSPVSTAFKPGTAEAAFACTVVSVASLTFFPGSVCVAVMVSPALRAWSTETSQRLFSSTVVLFSMPSGRVTMITSEPAIPVPEMVVAPALTGSMLGWLLSPWRAWACTVVSAVSLGARPAISWVAVSFWPTSVKASSKSTSQVPVSSTVASCVFPWVSVTTILAPGVPEPLTKRLPTSGVFKPGCGDFSKPSTTRLTASLGLAPISVCVAWTVWSACRGSLRSMDQRLFSSTVVSTVVLSGRVTTMTLEPAIPVPETVVSPAFRGSIVGWALSFWTAAAWTIASAGSLSFCPGRL